MSSRSAVFYGVFAIAAIACSAPNDAGSVSHAGRARDATQSASLPTSLPNVAMTSLDSQATDLARTIAGRPALVSLWASWCEACADEFASLNRLDAYARANNAIVVAIAEGDAPDVASDVVRRHSLAYTQLVERDFKVADALGERRVPTTLVVDRDGRVVYEGGAFDAHALNAFRDVVEHRRREAAR